MYFLWIIVKNFFQSNILIPWTHGSQGYLMDPRGHPIFIFCHSHPIQLLLVTFLVFQGAVHKGYPILMDNFFDSSTHPYSIFFLCNDYFSIVASDFWKLLNYPKIGYPLLGWPKTSKRKFQTWEIHMGPDRFWFFGFKALQKCKNFEIWTIFRYCKMRSKFYYITRLRDMGENSKIDFFQVFHFELYSYFHSDKS